MGEPSRGVRKRAKKAKAPKKAGRRPKKKAKKEKEAKPKAKIEEKPIVLTGRLLDHRWGTHGQRMREGLLSVDGCDNAQKAKKLVGRGVLLRYPKRKVIKGKIVSTHGSKGVLRARFRKGLAGDAIGLQVRIT